MPVQSSVTESSVLARVLTPDPTMPVPATKQPLPLTWSVRLQQLAQCVVHWIHAWFILILIAVDIIAALWPNPGQSLRTNLGRLPIVDLDMSLPNLLLAGMLFNAGLALRPEYWHQVGRRPILLILGSLGCWAIPLAILCLVIWPFCQLLPIEHQAGVWLGLVIVAAMPAAQSSTAWTQNARGNVLLCLSIVLATNLMCPIVIPYFVQGLGDSPMTTGLNWDQVFSSRVLLTWVIVPSLLGWSIGSLLGRQRLDHWQPCVSLSSALMLLTLNYINAADALPKLLDTMQLGTVLLTLGLAFILCGGSYGLALLLGHVSHLPTAERTALAYALGMKNNGVALMTMTSSSLGEIPQVSLVLICYIVLQHLLAGVISQQRLRTTTDEIAGV